MWFLCMQSRELNSIGAMSLEGLEHGNWTTKIFENTRVWKGDSKVGNKQLFRFLRMRGSPTLKRASVKMKGTKRKEGKCSKCHQFGHRKNNKNCPFFYQQTDTSEDDSSNENIEEHEPLNFSDETA